MTKTREWLLLNAVESWLYHYERNGTHETVAQYKKLRDELHDTFIKTLESKDAGDDPKSTPKPRTTRKRTNATKPAKTV